MFGACGCNMDESNVNKSEQQIVAEMKEHLTSKYGNIEYDIEGFLASGWDQPYDVLNLTTKVNGIKESFSVERYVDGDEYIFTDNYFGLVVRDEFEKKISEIACKYFSEFRVFAGMTSNNYPNSLTNKSSFEDLLEVKDELRDITFIVIVDETFQSTDEFVLAAESFVEEWSLNEIASTPRVIYLSTDVYKTIQRENYRDVLVDNRIKEYSTIIK